MYVSYLISFLPVEPIGTCSGFGMGQIKALRGGKKYFKTLTIEKVSSPSTPLVQFSWTRFAEISRSFLLGCTTFQPRSSHAGAFARWVCKKVHLKPEANKKLRNYESQASSPLFRATWKWNLLQSSCPFHGKQLDEILINRGLDDSGKIF